MSRRMVSYLTEELVAQGRGVTLYASGQSVTSARLVPFCPEALRQSPTVRDHIPYHLLMLAKVRRMASQFDILHFHTDQLLFRIIRDLGRQDLPDLKHRYEGFPEMPLVSVSNAQRRPMPTSSGRCCMASLAIC
jgi:hypothetical protein